LTATPSVSKIRDVGRTGLLLIAAALVVVAGAAAAQDGVRKVRVTSPVQAGEMAALTVAVAPRARCSIALSGGSYVASTAALAPKAGGRITWRWRVPLSARGGLARARVACGTSGTLRTTFEVIAKPVSLSLAEAKKKACARVPQRVQSKYRTQLVPLLDRTLEQLRAEYRGFDCAWGSNYYPEGTPISYYLVSIAAAKAPCTFAVTARVVWPGDPALPGYAGPVSETYTETCKSLGA
jgi:hypothetical protein